MHCVVCHLFTAWKFPEQATTVMYLCGVETTRACLLSGSRGILQALFNGKEHLKSGFRAVNSPSILIAHIHKTVIPKRKQQGKVSLNGLNVRNRYYKLNHHSSASLRSTGVKYPVHHRDYEEVQ